MTTLSRRGLLNSLAVIFGSGAFPASSRAATADWNALVSDAAFANAPEPHLNLPGGLIQGSTDTGRVALGDRKNIVIEGNGSTLKLDGRQGPFLFKNCENISLRNFSIDLQTQGYIQAEVVNSAPGGRQVTMRVFPGFPAPVLDELATLFVFDKNTGGPAHGTPELGRGRFASVTPRGPSLYDFAFTVPLQLPSQAILLMKRKSGASPAFVFENCRNITLDHVTIRSAPQMGFVFHRCQDIRAQNLVVQPAAGSGRLLATGADGFHASQTRGKIEITNCLFDGLGDDCINVHDFYLRSAGWSGQNSLQLTEHTDFVVQHGVKSSDNLPFIGDKIQLLDPATLRLLTETTVSQIDASGDKPSLHFSTPVATQIAGQPVLVCDASAAPALHIDHCHFSRTRARGIAAHSNARIENCDFTNTALSGIALLVEAKYWGEGCGIDHIAINKNTFRNCGLGQPGAISSATLTDGKQIQASNHDITITGNTFQTCPSPILDISDVSGVTLSQNNFLPDAQATAAAIRLQRVSELRINNNSSSAAASIETDKAIDLPKDSGNKGLTVKLSPLVGR